MRLGKSATANSWSLQPLEDVTEDVLDRRGVTPLKLGSAFKESGHRVISAKVIKSGTIDLSADEPRFVDDSTYAKWMRIPLDAGDVILTSEAPLGEVAYLRQKVDWCLGQRLFAIRAKQRILDGRFLYYAIQSSDVQHDILSRASGTTVHGIRQSELRKVLLPVPPLSEQRAIARVLGAFDDKIELNRKMSATLEAMARALFKSWFVDFDPVRAKAEGRDPGIPPEIAALFPDSFEDSELGEIPKGWHVGALGEVAMNQRRAILHANIPAETPYIGLEHMPRRNIALDRWERAAQLESNKSQFRRGEFLFGKLRPYFHKVGIAPIDGVCSTDILVVSPSSKDWAAYVLMHLSSDELVAHTDRCSTGTKMPRASWDHIAGYEVNLPPTTIARTFAKAIAPMMERIISAIHESQTLAALRDALLPKLISGEVRVTDAERLVG